MPELIIPPESVLFYMPIIYLTAAVFLLGCFLIAAYVLGDISDELD